ncbi:hypothetical protein ACPCSP_20185 [Streptomyces cinereoruber]|uniref:hypothetical protein n=1 Tax=Streptomyces cinereoruber TaxID=67260 RepID=UPI003C2F3297
MPESTLTTAAASARRPLRERGECPACHIPYALTKSGRVGWHHGITEAGFSTGETCDGVGRHPFIPAGA